LAADKTLIDYFLPMLVQGRLTKDACGADDVLPRDPWNALEDMTMKQWCCWDGQTLKAPDGKFHLFASRWNQSTGHGGWVGSLAVHAVSDKAMGPYKDTRLTWPENRGDSRHNLTALQLPDKRYAVVVSETRPGGVFVSQSLARGNDHHGSKILVVPFDGVRFDREMQRIINAEERSANGVTWK
jgi:hypothetical protein